MPVPEERPPPYPPRYTFKAVRLLVIAALKNKPKLPASATMTGQQESDLDVNIRRVVERYVLDHQHREQLRIWAWCQADNIPKRGRPSLSFQEGSFREQCDERGWSVSTALRNVEHALGMIFMMMNLPGEGRY